MRFLPIVAVAVFVFTGCSESDKTTTTVAPTTGPVTSSPAPALTIPDALDGMIKKIRDEKAVNEEMLREMCTTLAGLTTSGKREDQIELVSDYLVKNQPLLEATFEKISVEIRSIKDFGSGFDLIPEFLSAQDADKKAAAVKLVTSAFDKLPSKTTHI